MSNARFGKILTVWATLAAAFLVVSASAESKVRFIRLSEVQGLVQLDRNAGDGFDKAFLNLPVIEGSRLRTGRNGHAEVEFEDGSELRLTPNSEVDFTHLALEDDGQMISAVQLVSGTVYANLRPKKSGEKAGDQFALNFAHESVTVAGAAHFRVELDGASKATLAVFKGKVSATSPSGGNCSLCLTRADCAPAVERPSSHAQPSMTRRNSATSALLNISGMQINIAIGDQNLAEITSDAERPGASRTNGAELWYKAS